MEGRYTEIDVKCGDSLVYSYKRGGHVETYLLEIFEYDRVTNKSCDSTRIGSYEEGVLLMESRGKRPPVRLENSPVCLNHLNGKLKLDKKWKCIWST